MNQEIVKELDKILPVVVRVHGEHHPELHQVAVLYAQLKDAPSAAVIGQLKEITGNFTAPADACPTFRKTYAGLEALAGELK